MKLFHNLTFYFTYTVSLIPINLSTSY